MKTQETSKIKWPGRFFPHHQEIPGVRGLRSAGDCPVRQRLRRLRETRGAPCRARRCRAPRARHGATAGRGASAAPDPLHPASRHSDLSCTLGVLELDQRHPPDRPRRLVMVIQRRPWPSAGGMATISPEVNRYIKLSLSVGTLIRCPRAPRGPNRAGWQFLNQRQISTRTSRTGFRGCFAQVVPRDLAAR